MNTKLLNILLAQLCCVSALGQAKLFTDHNSVTKGCHDPIVEQIVRDNVDAHTMISAAIDVADLGRAESSKLTAYLEGITGTMIGEYIHANNLSSVTQKLKGLEHAVADTIIHIVETYQKDPNALRDLPDWYAADSKELYQGYTMRIPNGPCVNMDLESCDFTGWDLFTGQVDGNPYGYVNVTPTTNWGTGFPAGGVSHSIVTGGTDPNAGISMVNPNSGGCTAMIGDGNSVGGQAASMSQTFLVDATNANFTYYYAVVLQNPNHGVGDQPFFRIRMYDGSGAEIVCATYDVTSGNGDPNWQSSGSIEYIDWQTAFIPLQAYIGQNVTIEFTVGDCDLGGHYGYAYVESTCAPLEIIPSDTLVCQGVPVTLTAPSGALNYLWSTGETTQTISVNQPGNYSVNMTAVSGCAVNLDVNIYGGGNVLADFDAIDVCEGTPTNFTDQSSASNGISTWSWDFDNDGTVDDVTANPTYNFGTTGTYPVNLSVTDPNGCIHDTTITIVVNPQPLADFSVSPVCHNTPSVFTDLSTGTITSWAWDFDNDGIIDDVTTNPNYTYPSTGSFNPVLTVSNASGCTSTISNNTDIYPNPVAAFTHQDVCDGDQVTYTDNSTISSGAIWQWVWDFGDGSAAIAQNTVHGYPTDGTYSTMLTVTSSFGCSDSIAIPVTIFPMPSLDLTSTDTDGCTEWCVDFTNLSTISSGTIQSYTWDLGDGSTSNEESPSNCYVNNTITQVEQFDIALTIVSDQGCTVDTLIPNMISVYPLPIAEFSSDPRETTILDPEIEFTNLSQGATIYNWDFAGLGSSTDENPSFTFPSNDEGVYTICLDVENQWGCTDDVCHDITIEGEFLIYVPNAFTPDGDGTNDYFFPVVSGYDETYFEWWVFDRWGEIVFKGNSPDDKWPGQTFRGREVKEDVYVWKIHTRNKYTYEKVDLIGHVTLLK